MCLGGQKLMRSPWARRLLSSVSDRVFKAWGWVWSFRQALLTLLGQARACTHLCTSWHCMDGTDENLA